MALVVGELTAYLGLDASKYDSGVQKARGDLKSLGQQAQTSADQTETRTSRLVSTVGRAASAAAQAAGAVFAAGTTTVAGLIISAGKAGVAYNGMQQASRAALSTILGGAEAANAQMDKLDEFARNSPFAKQVFITAQQQLLGFGMAADKVLPTLDAIQQATAAVGGSNEQIAEIANILAVVTGTGKITAETLNQLGYRGVDAAKLIGSQMGLTANEVREKITKGTLDAGEALDALVAGMQTSFGGAADNVKNTWVGATDRIKGAWRDIGSAIAEPFVSHTGGGMAIAWVNSFADLLRAIQRQIPDVMGLALQRVAGPLTAIGPALIRAREAVDNLDLSKLNDGLDKLSKYAPLIAGVGTALFTLGAGSLPILKQLGFAGINPVVAGLVALAAASPAVRDAAGQVLGALTPLAPVLADVAKILAGTLIGALDRLAPALGDLGVAVAPLIVSLAQGLVPVAQTLAAAVDVAVPVVEALASALGVLAGWVDDLGPVLPAVVTAIIGLKAAQGVAGMVGSLSKSLENLAIRAGVATEKLTGSADAGEKVMGGMGRVSTAVGRLGTALPILGVAVGLFSAAMSASTQQTRDFAQAILDGGAAADRAYQQMGNPSFWDKFLFNLTHWGNTESVATRQTREAQQAARDLLAAMSPLDRAHQAVTTATNNLAAAQDEYGTNSLQARDASASLRSAQAELAQKQRDVEEATKGATEALAEQVNQAMNAASADLAARQARLGVQEAQQRYNEVLADGEASANDRLAAEQALEGAYLNAAQAAARKADADSEGMTEAEAARASVLAQLEALESLRDEMGGNLPPAIASLIESLRASASQATDTATDMDNLGISVRDIPNEKSVIIDAPTWDQKKRLQDLGYTVENIPGTKQARVIRIDADTSAAETRLNALVNRNYAINVRANLPDVPGVRRFGMAAGGPVTGGVPGRDSVPIMAMPGEHMWTTAEVNAAGGHGAVEALRRAVLGRGPVRGLADGGQVARPVTPAATAVMDRPGGFDSLLHVERMTVVDGTPRELAQELAWTMRVGG